MSNWDDIKDTPIAGLDTDMTLQEVLDAVRNFFVNMWRPRPSTPPVVVPPPANRSPIAVETVGTITNRTVTMVGTGSSDSDGTIVSYDWDWGDGTTHGTGGSATHTYLNPGTYTVRLTVTDDKGATGSQAITVTVSSTSNVAPTASFSSTVTKLSVAFNGSGSTDTDGTIVSYDWDWGDGTAHGSGATPTHVYAAGGAYVVVLTVTDNLGATGTATHTVTAVANVPPVASFTKLATNLVVNVNGTGSTDSDGTITAYDWNWGDGSAHSSGSTSSHTYAAAGTYTITLKVTDNNGATNTTSQSVSVVAANLPPSAGFTITGQSYLTVNVNGGSSTDPDGTISTYDWNWGDGSAHGSGQTPSHTYTAAGTYNITLLVTDNNGGTNSVSHSVTVVADVAPTASFSVTNKTYLAVTVNGSASSDPDGTITGYDWNWGDGTAHGSGPTPGAHTYAANGTYTVTLTVTDDQGKTGAVSTNVTVAANVPPTASFSYVVTNLSVAFDGTASDADGTIASVDWNWGDGTTHGTTIDMTHVYAAAGTYTVTLKVTDDQGAQTSTSLNVTVNAGVLTPQHIKMTPAERLSNRGKIGASAQPVKSAWDDMIVTKRGGATGVAGGSAAFDAGDDNACPISRGVFDYCSPPTTVTGAPTADADAQVQPYPKILGTTGFSSIRTYNAKQVTDGLPGNKIYPNMIQPQDDIRLVVTRAYIASYHPTAGVRSSYAAQVRSDLLAYANTQTWLDGSVDGAEAMPFDQPRFNNLPNSAGLGLPSSQVWSRGKLDAGWYGTLFAEAFVITDQDNPSLYSSADRIKIRGWLKNTFLALIKGGGGRVMWPLGWNGQAAEVEAWLNIAIALQDQAEFNAALAQLKYMIKAGWILSTDRGLGGTTKCPYPLYTGTGGQTTLGQIVAAWNNPQGGNFTNVPDGHCPEDLRDLSHAGAGRGSLMNAAMTCFKHNIDLFSETVDSLGLRIRVGHERNAGYVRDGYEYHRVNGVWYPNGYTDSDGSNNQKTDGFRPGSGWPNTTGVTSFRFGGTWHTVGWEAARIMFFNIRGETSLMPNMSDLLTRFGNPQSPTTSVDGSNPLQPSMPTQTECYGTMIYAGLRS